MFTNLFMGNIVFPHSKGFNRMFLDSNCKEKYGFTDEEFMFMSNLVFLDKYELVPEMKNGNRTGNSFWLHPFCVALYDFYYGSQIALKDKDLTKVDAEEISRKQALTKTIVIKFSKKDYKKMF